MCLFICSFICSNVYADSYTTYYFKTNKADFNVDSSNLMQWLCNDMNPSYCHFHFTSKPSNNISVDDEGWSRGSSRAARNSDNGLSWNFISESDYDKIDRFSLALKDNPVSIREALTNLNVCGDARNVNCYDWVANYYCGDGKNSFTKTNELVCSGLYDTKSDVIEDNNYLTCQVPVITVGKDVDGNNIGGNGITISFKYQKSNGDISVMYGDEHATVTNHSILRDNNTFHLYSKGSNWGKLEEKLRKKFEEGDSLKCDESFGVFCGGSESGYDENHWYFLSNASLCTDNPEDYNGTYQVTGGGSNFITYAGDIDFTKNISFIENNFTLCDDNNNFLGDKDLTDKLKIAINVFKIIVPVLLLVLGSIDFVRAIFAQDDGEIKKAQSKFIKRLIIAVVIFLIPSVLKVILGIASGIWKDIVSPDLCGLI